MSYFLWIEDFEGCEVKATASDVLSEITPDAVNCSDKEALKRYLKSENLFLELSLQDGLEFINNRLEKIDYIILDINLVPYLEDDPINSCLESILKEFHNYSSQENESLLEQRERIKALCSETQLKENGGYYLFTQLIVEQGFPKHHILFCSNHGDTTISIQDTFKSAKIALPRIYKKSDTEVKEWVKSHYENPYSRLRRGIIEGCRYLKDKNLRFKDYSTDEKNPVLLDLDNYLAVLENFLPLHKPDDNFSFYKLFVRTLSHEWDEVVKPKKLNKQQITLALSWIMKITRNWSAHSKAFEKLEAQDVAFLFIINMRAMFDLGSELLPYEKYLLGLFNYPLTDDEFKTKIGSDYKNRKIPLTQNYAAMLTKYGTNYEAISYHDLINELQKNNKAPNNAFLIKGLYQVFWFLTSYGCVYIDPYKIQNQTNLNYQFRYFDYSKENAPYLFEIGRHIYYRSFPEA